MKASYLLAPIFLSILQGQSAQTRYPQDLPADLPVTTADNKPVVLNDILAKGKTLLVFSTDACPMMPQGGKMSPLADYAAIHHKIASEKLEDTRVVIIIDHDAKDYLSRNPVIKGMEIYNAPSKTWDALGAQRANESLFVEDGKIIKKNPGSSRDMLTDTVKFLGLKTDPKNIFTDLGAEARKRPISGCTPMWPEMGARQARIFQPGN